MSLYSYLVQHLRVHKRPESIINCVLNLTWRKMSITKLMHLVVLRSWALDGGLEIGCAYCTLCPNNQSTVNDAIIPALQSIIYILCYYVKMRFA